MSAGAYVVGSIVYWFLGSAEVQSWGKYEQKAEVQETSGVVNQAYEKM